MKEFKPQFDGQHDDEEVLMVFRRHPVVMRKGLIALLIGLVIGMIPSLIWPTNLTYLWFAPLGMLLGGVFLFYSWIGWFYSLFIVSDQRLISITQKGMFNRAVTDISLDKIQSINYKIDGFQETVLRFGTILVQTIAGDLVLDNIPKPQDINEKMGKIIKQHGNDTIQTETETEDGEE